MGKIPGFPLSLALTPRVLACCLRGVSQPERFQLNTQTPKWKERAEVSCFNPDKGLCSSPITPGEGWSPVLQLQASSGPVYVSIFHTVQQLSGVTWPGEANLSATGRAKGPMGVRTEI